MSEILATMQAAEILGPPALKLADDIVNALAAVRQAKTGGQISQPEHDLIMAAIFKQLSVNNAAIAAGVKP